MGAINNMPVGGFSSGDKMTGADPVSLNMDASNSVRMVYVDDEPGNMRGEQSAALTFSYCPGALSIPDVTSHLCR